MAKINRKKARQAGVPVARMPNIKRKIFLAKKRTYKHKGLKKGWAINWEAKIIYKISKMPRKGKKFKPW